MIPNQTVRWLLRADDGTSLNNPISAAELTLIGVIDANATVLSSQIASAYPLVPWAGL